MPQPALALALSLLLLPVLAPPASAVGDAYHGVGRGRVFLGPCSVARDTTEPFVVTLVDNEDGTWSATIAATASALCVEDSCLLTGSPSRGWSSRSCGKSARLVLYAFATRGWYDVYYIPDSRSGWFHGTIEMRTL